MVNIEYWWDGQPWGQPDIPIVGVFRDEWEHPDVGHEVRIKGKIVKITRKTEGDAGSKIFYVQNINGNAPYRNNK